MVSSKRDIAKKGENHVTNYYLSFIPNLIKNSNSDFVDKYLLPNSNI